VVPEVDNTDEIDVDPVAGHVAGIGPADPAVSSKNVSLGTIGMGIYTFHVSIC